MSCLHVFFNICCLAVSINSMTWFSSDGLIDIKPGLLGDGGKMWLNWREKISGNNISKIHHVYYQYIGSERARNWKSWCRKFLFTWVVFWSLVCLCIFTYMNAQAFEKRKESLANMCDERARMLQDLFNVSMNHVQALSILISTFHHERDPSAIDQETFATYTERTSFERPLMSGVAYAVRVLHSEREQFEKQQGWTIKKMNTFEQTPVHKHDYAAEKLKPSPYHKEYAPVIFAQDTVSHVISVDMLSGKEDRENILRARASGKGVLTSPFRLIKTNRLGVILTFAVYKIGLSSSASSDEMIQASLGYLGGIFDIESLVERLLDQLASKQTIRVNVYDTTNILHPISMYSSSVSEDALEHASSLNFGDPFRKHEMHCSFKERPPWPLEAIVTSVGILVIVLLLGYIFHVTVNRIAKVEDDYEQMMELKKRAEAADIAKSQFLATVSHEIRTPMNGVLGMLQMLMDTDLDVTQQDYVRTAQTSGRALVSLINEVLDQARIEYGKLELEVVPFELRAIMDDVLSLFSGKSQEKGVELAAYVSDRVPKILIGDPGRFRQIITNLVGNSIKFTEEGHIFVTVHLVEEVMNCLQVEAESLAHKTLSRYRVADRRHSWRKFKNISQNEPYCQFSLSSNPINIIVSVEDTGVGIPEEAQQRVFTPFMQVGPSMTRVGGTGIGLSISKYLVGFMNGEIGFVSIPKIGSTFSFNAVFSNGCSSLDYNNGQKISNQADPISSEFIGTTALVVDNRSVRAKVSRYHIQRLGISVEITSDLNQEFSAINSGKCKTNTTVDMVFVEQEVWDDNLGFSDLFVNKFMKNLGHGVPPKLFILSNSIALTGSSKAITSGEYIPTFIRKPLRAGMLAASIKQAMGVENKGNSCPGQVLSLPLRFLQGRKILVVDDNRVNLRVAFGALKKYGADVVCAATGKEAIALLEPPHSFDACFMDIQMPEMDGFVATGIIRDLERNINSRIQSGDVTAEGYENVTNRHLPILAMTADVIQATHEKCLRCGMDGYVTKPFEAEQLCREVSRFFQSASSRSL